MNKVILMGRLTRDPEVRYSEGANSTCVAKFSIAVDRRKAKEGEQSADFINCTGFGKIGEFVEKYLKKGSKILVTGRWQTGSYTNKDGKKVYTNDCILENVEFAESKKEQAPEAQPQTDADGFMNLPEGIDEELPFN